ncbi:hypothetical protein Pelo_12929 [Pelomyxa schiedti]|nr:hypothetical protein Pelo_12929 [Pelomyxa schiedti]
MGKGIVVKFTQRFGNMRPELQSMNLSVGDVGAIARPPSRWVFNIVNKEKHWSKATYQDLQRGLQSLAAHCMDKGVTNLAMPAIGCGLDGFYGIKTLLSFSIGVIQLAPSGNQSRSDLRNTKTQKTRLFDVIIVATV